MELTMEDNLEDMLDQLLIFDSERAAKANLIMKTKVGCVNSLLKRYAEKRLMAQELQSSIINIKELYKQSCIDRMELREKHAALEEEIKKLQTENKKNEEKFIAAINQCEGIQSHSRQLELLIKENETTIEALKIENNLERSSSKDFEKKNATLQKENNLLIKNIGAIRDVVFGKKKATKDIKSFLNKYGKFNESQEENSSDETDAFEDCLSPLTEPVYDNILVSPAGKNNKTVKLQSINIIGENIINRDDNDSQSSSEIVSSDTGRGSSLAFSDSDKCSVLSPEYYVHDSPAEARSNKDDKMVVSVATSPLHTRESTCVATSPIIFEDSLDQMDIELPTPDITTKTRKSSPSAPIIMVDRLVSPIFVTQYVDSSTNTDKNINSDVGTSPVNLGNRTSSCSYASEHNIQEQECLDINNSNNLIDENSNDGEIQMIFDAMRFNTKLITPIPTTPAKPRFEVARNIASQTLLNIPDLVKKEDLAPIFAQIAMLQQEMKNVITECQRTKSSISILESSINAGAQQKLKDSYLMKLNKEIKLSGKRLEPEAALVRQNDDTFMATEGTKNIFDFKSKISKMKELFDDSSPPRPSEGLLLQPPVMPLSRFPWSPSHVIHSTSPVSHSHSADTPSTLLPSAISRSILTPPPPSVSSPPVSPIMSPSSKSSPFVSPPPVSPPPVSPPPVSPPPVSPPPVSPPPVSPPPVSPPPVLPPPVTSPIKSPSSKSSPIVLPPPLLSPTPMSPPPVSPPPVLSPPVLPPPVSPSSVTPLPSSAARGDIMTNNNTEGNRSFKSKERLHFEDYLSNQDALSDEGMSDQDISLPVVVELSSDCHENDIGRLHKIVEEKQRQLEQELQSEEISLETQKVTKPKRMTKLEKLRKNMAPKSKIKKPELQARKPGAKLRIQPKRLTANKERILSSDVIDPKAAYENARKVMAELKSKEKVSSKPNVANLMSKTTKKYVRKYLDNSPQLSSTHTVENEAEIHGLSESRSRESVSVLENLSPLLYQTTISQKDCVFESGNATVEKVNLKMITPKSDISDITSISAIEADNVPLSELKRTRSLNKCSDGNGDAKEYGSEVTHFNTNHLTSPSLRRYGKKRIAHKVETKCIHNNNTLTESYVHENPVLSKEESNEEGESENRKRLKRPSLDQPDVVPKRILRNTSVNQIQIEEDDHEQAADPTVEKAKDETGTHKNMISYDDLDMFENMAGNKEAEPEPPRTNTYQVPVTHARSSNNGILCVFLDKYSNYNVKKNLKISENLVNAICKQLEDSIGNIQKLPPKDTRQAMDKLVKDLQNRPPKHILAALIKYLKEPARKIESYNKIFTPPAPPMTKVEQILIYIVAQLNVSWPDFIEDIFFYIEYTLFMLNRTPEFDAIETLSHFYAVLCRYNKNRNRLRLFIIDAMYCLNFKAVPLIKQCLDVWMHILPLAHMGMAKGPLVTCLVYLLHFFKCEDKFNRVQDIRNVLHRKYFYQMSEWNETGMLEMFRNSIKELRDIPSEKKMLRMALIILAKRNGPRWCQANIIKNMLLPIIEEAGVPDRIKHFCVAMLGPLLKPFPIDMKVNCEIIMNQLFDMLKQTPSLQMEEAIFTSLIYMSRHNQYRVIKALLCWRPDNISKEFEDLLKNYVKERSVKSWRQVLAKIFVRE